MRRRDLFLTAAALALAACSKQAEGTEEIHYGRENCVKCGMMISDPHFAAEIRGGPDRALYKFDDVGCATNWLDKQAWRGDEKTDFWVMDNDGGKTWLKALDAWYTPGAMSPMNYGFAAHGAKTADAVNYLTMRAAVLAKG